MIIFYLLVALRVFIQSWLFFCIKFVKLLSIYHKISKNVFFSIFEHFAQNFFTKKRKFLGKLFLVKLRTYELDCAPRSPQMKSIYLGVSKFAFIPHALSYFWVNLDIFGRWSIFSHGDPLANTTKMKKLGILKKHFDSAAPITRMGHVLWVSKMKVVDLGL